MDAPYGEVFGVRAGNARSALSQDEPLGSSTRICKALLGKTDVSVGRLIDLTQIEMAAVIYLRLWFTSTAGKERVRQNLAMGLGGRRASQALAAFERLCFFVVRHGYYRIVPAPFGCQCINAAEAVFANFVANAAASRHDDAMVIALLLVGEDAAEAVMLSAESFGLALWQISQVAGHTRQGPLHSSHRPH